MGELDDAERYGGEALEADLEPDEGNLAAIEREIATETQTRRALVVLVGDRASDDERTGELMVELLEEDGYRVDAVVTVGGVGVGPRDLVPEATRKVLDRRLGGIEQALRASGLAAGSTEAGLSRGLAGVSGSTVVVNLADSRAAVRDGMATLGPLVSHVIEDLGRWRV